jgi:glutathione synthase/RimK-type ligase-like ATP-grasp enzyme
MNDCLCIAVGLGDGLWYRRFVDALNDKVRTGYPLAYDIVDLDQHDWVDQIAAHDLVIWKPNFMGPRSSSLFKEKIYFIETYLRKLVVPNFASVWHFESKVSQSYLFRFAGIHTPETTVSFNYEDALELVAQETFPLVFKRSHGAGSSNVKLIPNARAARVEISKIFAQQVWDRETQKGRSRVQIVIRNMLKPWLWSKIRQNILKDERSGVVYWQEYVPHNSADLRITAIGDRYAYGFWRNNRPGDFRASGSGRVDYQREIPEDVIKLCLQINRKYDFDSMAYDVLFDSERRAIIAEMSYGYLDSVPQKTKGYYELQNNGEVVLRPGHTWPEQLWVDWALIRAGNRSLTRRRD